MAASVPSNLFTVDSDPIGSRKKELQRDSVFHEGVVHGLEEARKQMVLARAAMSTDVGVMDTLIGKTDGELQLKKRKLEVIKKDLAMLQKLESELQINMAVDTVKTISQWEQK